MKSVCVCVRKRESGRRSKKGQKNMIPFLIFN